MAERQTRGRASSIETLPDDIKNCLDKMLRKKGTTQSDILEQVNSLLDEAGVEKPISKSALNRYSTRMETIGAKMRESQDVADMWVSRLGDKPTGEVGQLLIQMVRSLAFETTMTAMEGDEVVDPDMIKDLALGISRLEKASEMSLKREKEIRKAFAEEAATETEKVLSNQGMTPETIKDIKRNILGIV